MKHLLLLFLLTSCINKDKDNSRFVKTPCADTIWLDSGFISIEQSWIRVYEGETLEQATKRMDSTYGTNIFTLGCYEK